MRLEKPGKKRLLSFNLSGSRQSAAVAGAVVRLLADREVDDDGDDRHQPEDRPLHPEPHRLRR